jgi:tRNA(fMet)-specific endonuclease VapC
MMRLKYLLDTNTAIYVIKRRPVEVLDRFNQHAGQLSLSVISQAELMHGAEKSQARERNFRVLEDFLSRLEVLDYGQKAAAHYGEIRSDLEKRGTPIGVNDLHIAGHARSEGLTVVTNNEKEFSRVSGLRVENWL